MVRWLVVALLVVPVIEIAVIVQVGSWIGVLPTVALLLFESLLGAFLLKREGRRAWVTLRETLANGAMPDVALLDAALVVIGGTLLLTPGFVTDIVGFACVLPFTRPAIRRLVTRLILRRAGSIRLIQNRRVDGL
ncbi:MAG TPA: FxsA family protein [Nocardioidaceae bacterium]|jgi:UPF0716 protein FxsA|nr:FxsA family protein [Nocardioidaceae bacterium]